MIEFIGGDPLSRPTRARSIGASTDSRRHCHRDGVVGDLDRIGEAQDRGIVGNTPNLAAR
jgi:hypothetical protein